jgi:hypothetical protein
MPVLQRLDLRSRFRASGYHFLISCAVALLAAALVFGLWYPGPYRLLSGGRELFLLVTGVDIALGPLLTFAVFDLKKGWPHLRRDLAVIGLIQLAALGYGLHTVFVARPVAMVFEVDRFRVLIAAQVDAESMAKAPPEYRTLSLTGPVLVGTRKPAAGDENNDVLFKGLEGIDLAQRPSFWQPYEKSAASALARARPMKDLLLQYPDKADAMRRQLAEMKVPEGVARFLPLLARGTWVVILDGEGHVAGYFPVEGFF